MVYRRDNGLTGMSPTLDIAANRAAVKYTRTELARRLLWAGCWPLFRFSPRIFYAWRCRLLTLFGAQIGHDVRISNTAVIMMPWNLEVGDWSSIGEHALIYNLGFVRVGEQVAISQRAHICAGTHDHTLPDMPLIKSQIEIEDCVWVCADAFVGPGVKVHQGAVVAARAVIVRDVPSWSVVAGNPARFVKTRVMQETLRRSA